MISAAPMPNRTRASWVVNPRSTASAARIRNALIGLRSRKTSVAFVLLSIFSCIVQVALAIDPAESLSELHHTQWTTREGAPAGLDSITQTTDGFLWIGSSTGLYRFDGQRFERPILNNGAPITDTVSAVFALPENCLLVGMRFGGAFLICNGHVSHYGSQEGLPSRSVTAFARREDGSLWAQTTGGLFRLA
jgi:ligand-binding sensor domain-containing protein